MKKLFFALSVILVIISCTKDNNGQIENCVTTGVTYSGTVSPIISANCLGCHGATPSAPFSLNTYAAVKAKVDDGRLFGAISHAAGFSPMPKGGAQLGQCEINKIKAWIDAGAPNN
jgi:mono/diheme cytochrome c family protein